MCGDEVTSVRRSEKARCRTHNYSLLSLHKLARYQLVGKVQIPEKSEIEDKLVAQERGRQGRPLTSPLNMLDYKSEFYKNLNIKKRIIQNITKNILI